MREGNPKEEDRKELRTWNVIFFFFIKKNLVLVTLVVFNETQANQLQKVASLASVLSET